MKSKSKLSHVAAPTYVLVTFRQGNMSQTLRGFEAKIFEYTNGFTLLISRSKNQVRGSKRNLHCQITTKSTEFFCLIISSLRTRNCTFERIFSKQSTCWGQHFVAFFSKFQPTRITGFSQFLGIHQGTYSEYVSFSVTMPKLSNVFSKPKTFIRFHMSKMADRFTKVGKYFVCCWFIHEKYTFSRNANWFIVNKFDQVLESEIEQHSYWRSRPDIAFSQSSGSRVCMSNGLRP